jgi:DNA-binding MarR family transcriptional regulator
VLAQFRRGMRGFLRFSERVTRHAGATPALYQLMLAVHTHKGAEPPDIGAVAGALGLKHHSAVELVQRGAALDLVSRSGDPGDARRALVSLTPHGTKTLVALVGLHKAELQRIRRDTFDVLRNLD